MKKSLSAQKAKKILYFLAREVAKILAQSLAIFTYLFFLVSAFVINFIMEKSKIYYPKIKSKISFELTWPVEILLWGLAVLMTIGALSGHANSSENITFELINKSQYPVRAFGRESLPDNRMTAPLLSSLVLPITKNSVYKTDLSGKQSWQIEVLGKAQSFNLPFNIVIENYKNLRFGVTTLKQDRTVMSLEKWQFLAFIDESSGEYWRVSFKKVNRKHKSIVQFFLECKKIETNFSSSSALDIDALTYNVYFRPVTILNDGQYERVTQIPNAVSGHDIVSFSEAFDDDVRFELRGGLKKEYFYQTSVVGKDKGFRQDGGVFIASKWPILEEDEMLFGKVCSRTFEDCLAQKGIKYARIWMKGKIVNVFATHLQNGYGAKDEKVKLAQLSMLSQFIKSKVPNKNEIVLVLGDFNMKCPDRSPDFLSRNIYSPQAWSGADSYAPSINELAGGTEETVDYVTYALNYQVPTHYEVSTLIVRGSKEWRKTGKSKKYIDLSDHFPVVAKFKF